jgi:rhomboid family GlyGly-CTERM serine protease
MLSIESDPIALLGLSPITPRLYGGGFLLARLLRFTQVACGISVIAFFCQQYFDLLVFDKTAVTQGEYWRLLSGHFTHSSFSHAVWDIIAFSASLVWLATYSTRALIPSVVAGVLLVNILLLSNGSPINYYCGLSGILFSPLIAAAYLHAKHHKNVMGVMPLLLIVIKLIADLITQETVFVNTQWQAYPESHLMGAVAGLFVVGVIERLNTLTARITGKV